jgi:hypothetical protein
MITTIVLCSLLLILFGSLIYQILSLRSMYYNAQFISELRVVKSDAILLLTDVLDDKKTLSYNEILEVRKIVHSVNEFTENYLRIKKHLFTFKAFKNIYIQARVISGELTETHGEVSVLSHKFGHTIFMAFNLFVPFFKIRIILKLVSVIISFPDFSRNKRIK